MGWDINCHGGLDGKGGDAALPRAPTGKRQGKGPAADEIALATKMAGRQASRFAMWAQVNFPAPKDGAESGVAA